MLQIFAIIAVIVIAYLIGSIPFGWIIVRLSTGRDIRNIESGRTGGTNVWRAAGLLAGFFTAVLDVLKGAVTVWIVRWLIPSSTPYFHWIEIAAPLAAILGHNYSIYLLERREDDGKIRMHGGAGGATCVGGMVGLWPPAILFVIPLFIMIYFIIGYASVATMSVPIIAIVIFLVRAVQGASPWEYVFYGVLAEVLLVWALRPNIQRLREGKERMHGLRVWLKKHAEEKSG
jgi:acyl phosphate:glycerol-3-phosphate acyltransferase